MFVQKLLQRLLVFRLFNSGSQWVLYVALLNIPLMILMTWKAVGSGEWGWIGLTLLFWCLLIVEAILIGTLLKNYDNELLKLKEKANRDPLTGLLNRYVLEEVYIDLENKHVKNTCSAVMLDLDHFKKHNDRFGHLAGDQLLKRVSAIMQENMRTQDIIFRYGGDEFAIIMWGIVENEAETAVQRIQDLIFAETGCRISYGISSGDLRDGNDLLKLLLESDKNLYSRKRNCMGE